MRDRRAARFSLFVFVAGFALAVGCNSDDDDDEGSFWGAGANSTPATGGRMGGGRQQGGRTGSEPTGGVPTRPSDQELAQNCANQNPAPGATCNRSGLYCPSESGPCICMGQSWTCYAPPAAPQPPSSTGGSDGTGGAPATGGSENPAQGGVIDEPMPLAGAPGEGGTTATGGTTGEGGIPGEAGQPAVPEGGTIGEPAGGAPAEPQGGAVDEPAGGAPPEPTAGAAPTAGTES